MTQMSDRPTIDQIVEFSKNREPKYGTVTFNGVRLLITEKKIRDAIAVTAEFTHDPDVEKLATDMGIKLRKFR